MARLEFELDTAIPPERILAAPTDFTHRRPDLWPGLDREQYAVYQVGDTWAEIREGTSGSIWARERYDWSVPGTVRWTVQESSFSTHGDYVEARVSPRDGGGSRVHVTWNRRGKNLMGRITVALIALTRGYPVRRSIEAGVKRIGGAG